MKCHICNHINPERARFCNNCGARLSVLCSACGAVLSEGDRFCPGCTRKLPSASPADYTPRPLAEKILTSRSALEGERKLVTVLFCDIVESTSLAEKIGPEMMHTLLDHFFQTALAEIHRLEGTVNQFLGDGFMALFGAPVAHEDHARRAFLAALAIRHLTMERPIVLEGNQFRLVLRMGLNTGLVIVGAIGDNLRLDYTAVGDTTHVAARLQQIAEPGDILASDASIHIAKDFVIAEALGPVQLKGKARTILAYRVKELNQQTKSLEGAIGHNLRPFVGRQREWRIMEDCIGRLAMRKGHAVVIIGEPGVGKSRFLLEFSQSVADRGLLFFEGRCLSYGGTIPYLPVIDLLRRMCAIEQTDSPAAGAAKVKEKLRLLKMDENAAGPWLLRLFGYMEGDEPALPGEQLKARTFDALREFMLCAGKIHPLVLAVEDIHWIDRTSEEYLQFFYQRLADVPILLIVTCRPEYRASWMNTPLTARLSLGSLGKPESLAVLSQVLPEALMQTSMVQAILDRAGGNPFYLEELAQSVIDQGPDAGRSIPDNVISVLTARIDRLGELPKRLLQAAAILGREFSLELLQAVWQGVESLEPYLRDLIRLEFLHENIGQGGSFVFKHALTQQASITMLLAPARRKLHRRAAMVLEARHSAPRSELAPILAHHYHNAEAWPEAAEWAHLAAKAARSKYAQSEAIVYYDLAIAAAERAGLQPELRMEMHEGRGLVYSLQGQFQLARSDLEAALAMADAAQDDILRARALNALGRLWGNLRDYQKGLELAQEAARLMESHGDARELAGAWLNLGLMRLNLAQLTDAKLRLEGALRLYEKYADERGRVQTLDVLAMALLLAGDLDAAVAHYNEAIGRLSRIGDRQTEASCCANLGFALMFRGRRQAAEPWIRKARDVAADIGAQTDEAYVHGVTGEVLELYGEYGTALREASQCLSIARRMGHREWMALSLAVVGGVQRRCGDAQRAKQLHQEMLAIAKEAGSTLWEAAALGELGADYAHLGDSERAAALLTESINSSGDALKFALRPMLTAADLELSRGHANEALELSRRLADKVPQFEVFAVNACCIQGVALAALGRESEAERVLRQAKKRSFYINAVLPGWRAGLALTKLLRRLRRDTEADSVEAQAASIIESVAADLPNAALGRSFRDLATSRGQGLLF